MKSSERGIRKLELQVARSVLETVVAHARAAHPAECCGLLLGTGGVVLEAAGTRNIAEHPARFLIDPKNHIDRRRAARDRGLDVLGFYHSHPHSAAQPSERDLAEATYPDHLYLIVGMEAEPPEVQLFVLQDGNFRAVPFVTVD